MKPTDRIVYNRNIINYDSVGDKYGLLLTKEHIMVLQSSSSKIGIYIYIYIYMYLTLQSCFVSGKRKKTKEKILGKGIEPSTSAVLRPRHNQLDHPSYKNLTYCIQHVSNMHSCFVSGKRQKIKY